MVREIAGLSVPATTRERGFLLVGFLLGLAVELSLWVLRLG